MLAAERAERADLDASTRSSSGWPRRRLRGLPARRHPLPHRPRRGGPLAAPGHRDDRGPGADERADRAHRPPRGGADPLQRPAPQAGRPAARRRLARRGRLARAHIPGTEHILAGLSERRAASPGRAEPRGALRLRRLGSAWARATSASAGGARWAVAWFRRRGRGQRRGPPDGRPFVARAVRDRAQSPPRSRPVPTPPQGVGEAAFGFSFIAVAIGPRTRRAGRSRSGAARETPAPRARGATGVVAAPGSRGAVTKPSRAE